MSDKEKVYDTKKGTKIQYKTRKRSKISNRKPVNRFSIEQDIEYVSTSAKKLKLSKDECNCGDDVELDNAFGYRLLNFVAVFSAISELVQCKTCQTNVKFTETSKRGLGFKIVVSCEKCEKTYINSCPLVGHAYEVNKRIVLAMRLLGIGLHGIKKFCAFMELPRPIFQSFYDKIVTNISLATAAVREQSMKKAAAEEQRRATEKGETSGLTVSGDGSWRKRGFSSLFGVTTLIGRFTGKVLDLLVKSKYCKACEFWSKKEGTIEYEEWAESHSDNCQSNHEGSAGKMEVDSVVEMFSRSEALHGLKYKYYIGDGDSKTFKGILDAEPYENFTVVKKECIGHVQKRMGTRLRALVKKEKGLSGKGKLTGKLIDELSIYYGLAICRHCNNTIEEMRKAIWATLRHKLSTDAKPQHEDCPADADTWCSWQRAKAANTLHEYKHKPALNERVYEAIKPTYTDLSSDDLLTRCLGGHTQNNNECFNSVIWSIAPKCTSSGKLLVDIAADIAVLTFNDGLSSLMKVMEVLGMKIGDICYNFCLETDASRIDNAEHRMIEAAKNARRASTSSRKEEDETHINLEGQLYGAGIAE
ncbi:uncharacterized protein [Temnothorax nylanderi]|uniref:uncharacterized protein n=1 Tax=Temnothorax nylanderi TaxID=102681 RepID=UPI003A860FAA